MLPIIEKLLVLQDRDRRLLRVRAELLAVPGQRLMLQNRAAAGAAEYEALKKQSQHLESDRKKLELDADALKDRIGKVRVQQNETRSNDQYKAYEHQIETSQREISRLEDQQLELMEQSESASKQFAIATAAYAALKAESDRQLADLTAREKNLAGELAMATEARSTAATGVDDPAVLNRYDRLLKTKGDNVIVGVASGVCGGCHMKLPTQSVVSAKGQSELVACPSCSRILYFTADMG
jgi:predicted  nucleic acid-binding Zn-ribbon protein